MPRLIDELRGSKWVSLGDRFDAGAWNTFESAGSRERALEIAKNALDRGTRRARELRGLIEGAVPVVADEVASYVFAQEEPIVFREWDWVKDFPNLAPPFPRFFIEWARPEGVLAVRHLGEEMRKVVMKKEGLLFLGGPKAEADRCPLRDLIGQGADYEHYLCFSAFAEFSDGNPAELGVTAGVLVDGHGQVVGKPVVHNERELGGRDEWTPLFKTIAATGLLAISFMHCKSAVRMEAVEPPPRLNRARIRRGKLPLVRYKTLIIDGLKELLRREGEVGTVGLKRALHLVRGHFVTYLPDKPLFGHFVGTVFRSAHMRGKKDHGQVIKDYEIKAGEEPR